MTGKAAPTTTGTFVEASAGTGKTTVLVAAIAAAISDGVEVDRIAAVTFTHQAAGEMKLRVRAVLAKQRTERARRALQSLDRAFIGTIHSFCAALLRQRPVEGRVDPDFIELDESEALRFFGGVFEEWLETRLQSPTAVLNRAFAREAWRDGGGGPIKSLRSAAWALVQQRGLSVGWTKRPLDRARRVSELLSECERMCDLWPEKEAPWERSIFADVIERLTRARDAEAFNLDEAEAELSALRRRLKSAGLSKRTEAGKAWAELHGRLRQFAREMDADLASHLRDELWQVVEAYEASKQRLGYVDFTDLLLHARELLRHDDARADLQQRYERIFVDEFQDTDPLQAEILTMLATPEKLFVVGDPKQSIYRFRGAEPRVYADVREHLIASGAERKLLQTSWRSNNVIQAFVNSAFAGMERYLPIAGGPEALDTQPAIIALPAPKPYDAYDRIQAKEIVKCTPDVVGAFVKWLVGRECSWTVRHGETRRKITAGDVCILFRRATNSGRDLTEDYVRALEAHNIPHVLVGSKGLHKREEILVLRTALRAIEWPEDELSVYAVLRGPLFGIPDNTLFRCRESGIRLRPWARWPEGADSDYESVREALAILAVLHRRRNSQPIADTIRRLLEAVRGHAIFAFHKGGVRRLANVHRLAELARQADSQGVSSFRSFVERMEHEADSGEAAEAPVIEHQADGVVLMTTHKAKGLEFPVVILADPSAGLISARGPDRWTDLKAGICAQRLLDCAPWELLEHEAEEELAEREEGERVAYVAATRAQDLLVVCAIGDTEYEDGWLSPLYNALYPGADERRSSRPAPGCPAFGEDTVLNGPPHLREAQVRPGLHRPRTGSHQVVWFDPGALQLDVSAAAGSESEYLLTGIEGEIEQDLERYRSWQEERKQKIEAAAEPSCAVQVATEAGDAPEAASIAVEVVHLRPVVRRPAGKKFGRLLHVLLKNAGTNASAIGRSFDATGEEVEAAERAAAAVMKHPLLLQDGVRLLREYPVSVRLGDGTLIEGRADLVRDDGRTITVIDYKSDTDRERARRQVQLYAYALQCATGKPARGIIFEI